MTASLDPETLRLARVYLSSEDNRATHRRSQDREQHVVEQGIVGMNAAEYLTSAGYLDHVVNELRPLAETWNAHLGRPVRRVLDAGSGMGASALALARLYPDAAVTGVDIEAPAVDLARRLAGDEPHCDFVCSTLEAFEPAARFDLINCRAVLEHVFDPADVMGRLLTWLEPGGVAYVETPNYRWPWEPHLRMPMPPKGPKVVVRLIARACGRDANFVDHLNLECDPATILSWVHTADPSARVIDLMADKIRALFAGDDAARVAGRARIIARLRRWPRVADAAQSALLRLQLAPSVMLVVVKAADQRVAAREPSRGGRSARSR